MTKIATQAMFDTVRGVVYVHVLGCAALQIGGKQFVSQEDLTDLASRGYRVVRCRCVR